MDTNVISMKSSQNTFNFLFTVLVSIFCVGFVFDNFLEIKVFKILDFNVTFGIVIFPLMYILNDVFSELCGFRKTAKIVLLAFTINIVCSLILLLSVNIPSNIVWEGEEHFNYIFSFAPRITIASLAGFLAGSLTNSWIMEKMRNADGIEKKHFKTRAFISTIFGEFADSIFFFSIGFLFVLPIHEVFNLIIFESVVKIGFETISLPITQNAINIFKDRI